MPPPETAYEKDDVRIQTILKALLLLAGLILFVHAASFLAIRGYLPARTLGALPPEPRLEVVETEELARLRNEEEMLLHQYAWVNQKEGIVRIPIDRAMHLLEEKR